MGIILRQKGANDEPRGNCQLPLCGLMLIHMTTSNIVSDITADNLNTTEYSEKLQSAYREINLTKHYSIRFRENAWLRIVLLTGCIAMHGGWQYLNGNKTARHLLVVLTWLKTSWVSMKVKATQNGRQLKRVLSVMSSCAWKRRIGYFDLLLCMLPQLSIWLWLVYTSRVPSREFGDTKWHSWHQICMIDSFFNEPVIENLQLSSIIW